MTANRPGRVVYVTNGSGGALNHGQAAKEGAFVGTTIKQQQRGWDSTVAQASVIDASEAYALVVKGKVLVPTLAASPKGTPVYITSANALTKVATGNTKFGRVTEVAGERGTPAGFMWVDLDDKDSF